MGYAILRHGKVKGSGKGVCVAHNRRLAGEKKENIDASLTPLNQYLGDAGVVERINSKLPLKMRKDAVQVVELLLTASPEFFSAIEPDRRKLAVHPTFQEWKKATVAWAQAELGKNIVDIALHMDEHSPHMHVLFVPLIEGRLCAKEVTSRAEMVRRQTGYAEAMGKFGLKRGDPAADTHRKHTPLKARPTVDSGKDIEEQAAAIEELKAELSKVQAEAEKKALAAEAEVEGLKQALKALAAPAVEQPPPATLQAAQEALLAKWKPILREANKSDVANGRVVGSVDGLAVLHIGRGVHVSCALPAGAVLPIPGLKLDGLALGLGGQTR